MASLPAGVPVRLRPNEAALLTYPPGDPDALLAAPHPAALHAPGNGLTLVVELVDGEVAWVAAADEAMLERRSGREPSPRPALRRRLFVGSRMWQIVWLGHLVRDPMKRPHLTVYANVQAETRPWVVLGQLANGSLLAAPLNDASNPKWYTPRIKAAHLPSLPNKDGQLELPHLWSIDLAPAATGEVDAAALPGLVDDVDRYFAA